MLTFLRSQISCVKSLKLQAATFASAHVAPLIKSPPQYVVASSIPPSSDLLLPHGQLLMTCTPMLVSGHNIVILRSCLPECDGIIVLVAGQPSYKKTNNYLAYINKFILTYQIYLLQLMRC